MQCKVSKPDLLQYGTIYRAFNFARCRITPQVSQRLFLLLCLMITDGQSVIKSPYLGQYGISQSLAYYYYNMLVRLGYMTKIKRGHYQVTKSGHDLYNVFCNKLTALKSGPFVWR